MDLYLMDAILKGHLPEAGKVLDVGCGEGRNGIYFINQGYEYHGIDQDSYKIKLLEYLAASLPTSNTSFTIDSMHKVHYQDDYDVLIASRILHFSNDRESFLALWEKLKESVKAGGVLYFAVDSAIASEFITEKPNGQTEFEDGSVSFALTNSMYQQMKNGLLEVEMLKTIIYQKRKVQSFGLLRKL